MGTWAEGIYQNATAIDHVYDLLERLIEEVEQTVADPIRLEPDQDGSRRMLANLDLLRLISEHVYRQVWDTWSIRGPMLPDAKTIMDWKAKYLAAWDAEIDGLDPRGEYKRKHRPIIVATFDQLAQASQRQDDGPAEPEAPADWPRE